MENSRTCSVTKTLWKTFVQKIFHRNEYSLKNNVECCGRKKLGEQTYVMKTVW